MSFILTSLQRIRVESLRSRGSAEVNSDSSLEKMRISSRAIGISVLYYFLAKFQSFLSFMSTDSLFRLSMFMSSLVYMCD